MAEQLKQAMYALAQKHLTSCYAPYSQFSVVSCLASGGKLFCGVNVENASYSLTQCAEASAMGTMVTEGHRQIDAVMVLTDNENFCPPCGACLQRLIELASPDIPVYLFNCTGDSQTYQLGDMLPVRFGSSFLPSS